MINYKFTMVDHGRFGATSLRVLMDKEYKIGVVYWDGSKSKLYLNPNNIPASVQGFDDLRIVASEQMPVLNQAGVNGVVELLREKTPIIHAMGRKRLEFTSEEAGQEEP